MIYGIFSDKHGAEEKKLYDLLKNESDVVIDLGDTDRIKNALQIISLLKDNKNFCYLIGNHDASYINGEFIISGTLAQQGLDYKMAKAEWDENPEVLEFFKNILNGDYKKMNPDFKGLAGRRIEYRLENGDKMIAMHGAFAGEYKGEPSDLWNRLRNEDNHWDNFYEMEKRGYKVMIRGHDHKRELAIMKNDEIEVYTPWIGHDIDITDADMVVITVGAAFYGEYAIFNDSPLKRTVEFKQDKSLGFRRVK